MSDIAIKKDLENLIRLVKQDGNWNYDEYQLGLANGLILARSVVTNDEPEFLHPPKVWLKDIDTKTENDDYKRSMNIVGELS